MLSPVRLSSVYNGRATYAAGGNFGIFSTPFGIVVPWPSGDIHGKFYGHRPGGAPPPGELNARGVAKYSDFGPIEGHISETVQDRR